MYESGEEVFLEIERAKTLLGLGRFDAAASALHSLLGRDPENAMGWHLLAQAHLGRQDLDEALEAANRAVAIAPESEWGHRLRGVTLSAMGDHDGAITAAFEAVRLAPAAWAGYGLAARVLSRVKARSAEAVAAGARAVELAPNESDAHLAHGIAAAAKGERKDAEAAFRRALALDPQNADAHNELARLKLRTSRFRDAKGAANLADAAEGFRSAVQADPQGSVGGHNLELILRTFLARLTYLIFLVAYFCYRAVAGSTPSPGAPVSSPPGHGVRFVLVVALLCAPGFYGWRFASRLSPDLRQHLRYTVTHGRIAIVAAIQLVAILLLVSTVVASPSTASGTAFGAVGLSLVARILISKDIYRLTGQRMLSNGTLWFIAAAFASTAVLFAALGMILSKSGRDEVALGVSAAVSAVLCMAMLYVIRGRRA